MRNFTKISLDFYSKFILTIIALLLLLNLVVTLFRANKVQANNPRNVNIEQVAGYTLYDKAIPVIIVNKK